MIYEFELEIQCEEISNTACRLSMTVHEPHPELPQAILVPVKCKVFLKYSANVKSGFGFSTSHFMS